MPQLFLFSYSQVAWCFSTLPSMTRVRRFNASWDCLVCIVGIIAGGHYDQGRDSVCKATLKESPIFRTLASKGIVFLIFGTAQQN